MQFISLINARANTDGEYDEEAYMNNESNKMIPTSKTHPGKNGIAVKLRPWNVLKKDIKCRPESLEVLIFPGGINKKTKRTDKSWQRDKQSTGQVSLVVFHRSYLITHQTAGHVPLGKLLN